MKTLLTFSVCAALIGAWGCNSRDRANARDDMHKTAAELKQDGQELSKGIDKAIKPDTRDASQKLAEGKEKLEAAGNKASAKVSEAALVAQVKTNLASEAGLSTMTGIEVDAVGSVVTLRGHVASQAQKDAADHAAAKVDGVTRVENQITIAP